MEEDLVMRTLRLTRTPPIDALSSEVLIMVFKLLPRTSSEQEKNWSSFIHVCRRWRSVALTYPYLWKEIAPISAGHLSFMLSHSRSLPVTISSLRIVRDQASQIESLIAQHIKRVRQLELLLDPSNNTQVDFWLAKLLDPSQALSLQALTFEVLPKHRTPYIAALPVRTAIVIRSLKLLNIRIVMPRGCIQSNVTSFHFGTDDCIPTLQKTAWLLQTLSCLPELLHLHLHDAAFDDFELTGSTIPLLQLRSFTFSGSASGYLFLIIFLRIPANTRLSLSLGYVDDLASEEVGRLYSHLSTQLQQRREARLETYDIFYGICNVPDADGSPYGLRHTLRVTNSTPRPVPIPIAGDDPILDLKLVCVHKYELRPGIEAYRYLSLLTAHLSEGCVEALDLRSNVLYLDTESQKTNMVGGEGEATDDFKFLTWNGLRYLALHDHSAVGWISPYLALPSVFPGLKHLVVDGLNPSHGANSPDPVEVALSVKETLLNVRTAIATRAVDDAHQLETVTFTNSSVPHSWKDTEISTNWTSGGLAFDENDWDTYWAEPFETIETLEEYYADVFDDSHV